MAFVPGHSHDLFLSYAHAERAWADAFRKALCDEFHMLTGRPLAVWEDRSDLRLGQNWATEVELAVRDSAAFLAIVSPSYFTSRWCLQERQIFLENGLDAVMVESLYLFLKVIKTPGPDRTHEQFLPQVVSIDAFNGADGFELPVGSAAYTSMIRSSAHAVHTVLRALTKKAGRELYVACNSGDMGADRERLVRELEAQGFRVKPDHPLGPEFGWGAARSAMEKSSHAVFLLGASYDPYTEDRIRAANDLSKPAVFCIHTARSAHAESGQMALLSRIRDLSGVPPESNILTGPSIGAISQDLVSFLHETRSPRVPAEEPKPVRDVHGSGQPESVTRGPYPGLRPFEPDEAFLFFGREMLIQELLSRLSANRFLAVAGNSGSGKSSLVRAGLVPALQQGYFHGKPRWRVCLMRPGSTPLDNLACALAAQGLFSGDLEAVRKEIQWSRMGLARIGREGGLELDENLVLVVDQFEELFRFRSEWASRGGEASHFVYSLLGAADSVYVILIIRSDFVGECAMFPDLAEALNSGQYLVPRPRREQLREAIEGPLQVSGIPISPALIQRLLNDLGDDPDQLSLLQHALNRTFQVYQGNKTGRMGIEHYQAAGELAGALDRHAEFLFASLRSEDRSAQRWAERVFRCLTTVENGRRVRRPTRMEAICQMTGATDQESRDLVRRVIEIYASHENSLLVCSGTNLSGDSIVDIAHEILIAKWERLRRWTEAEAEAVRLYRAAAEDAREDGGGQTKWRGARLSEALDLLALGTWTEAWAHGQGETRVPFSVVSAFMDHQRLEQEKEQKTKESLRGFYSCFISYSTKDQVFADRLCADLQAKGVRCWFAPHDIQGGKKIYEQIEDAIQVHDRLLLILSEHSMNSEWVKTEIDKARKRELKEKRRMLFPIRLVSFETLRDWECFDADFGKDSAREIREFYVPDFSRWEDDRDAYLRELDRLLRDLRASQVQTTTL
jgi:hypothetical protein